MTTIFRGRGTNGRWYVRGRALNKTQMKAAGIDPNGEHNKGVVVLEISPREIARVVSEEAGTALAHLIEKQIDSDS